MKKRISKDKENKIYRKQHKQSKVNKNKNRNTPIRTLQLLIQKTQSINIVNHFEKSKIQLIMQGGNLQAINYRQIEHNHSHEQYIRKYYGWNDIKHIFTNLITKSALVNDITFIDFKAKNFKILNNYGFQHKKLLNGKNKEELNQTTLNSQTKQKYLKELQINAHKVTNKVATGGRNKGSNQTSFLGHLVKNIEKMIKNVKQVDISSRQNDFNHILQKHEMNTPNISRIYCQRVHTTPQPMLCDNYGLLQPISQRNNLKNTQNINISSKMKHKQTINKQIVRFHTQYDTEYIVPTDKPKKSKKSLSKSSQSLSKKQFSKKKKIQLSKSPQGNRFQLRLKKK